MKVTGDRPPGNGGKKAWYANPDRKPAVLPVNPDGIPAELQAADRWVLWALTWKANKDGTGKWDKVPKTPAGRNASSTNPETWVTFAAATSAYRTGGFDGVGFVLGGGRAGIDLDGVRDRTAGTVTAQWAAELIARAGTAADVSPSGTGVKLFGRGKWSGGWHKRPHPSGAGEIEVYDAGRYFTVTGHAAEAGERPSPTSSRRSTRSPPCSTRSPRRPDHPEGVRCRTTNSSNTSAGRSRGTSSPG